MCQVSKSANYCYTSPQNPFGLLLLGEVALVSANTLFSFDLTAQGRMKELTKANDRIKAAPRGFQSVKGVGRNMPDPSGETPLGEPHEADASVTVRLSSKNSRAERLGSRGVAH